jgi:hypothetical protein
MIDDRSVGYVVFVLIVVIAVLAWPVARRSGAGRRRRSPIGRPTMDELAAALGIGIIVQSVEAGPPATIEASLLLDTRVFGVVATGATESEAYDDLARKAVAWKNEDERNVRTYFGGA